MAHADILFCGHEKRRGEEFGVICFRIAVFRFTVCNILNPTFSKALEFPQQL